jgi:aminoglycoside phosphotransferase (APT) family kinase protein
LQIGAKMNSNNSNLEYNDPLTDPGKAARVLHDASAEAGWQVREVRSIDVVGERPDKRRTLRFRVSARRAGGPSTESYWYATQYRGGEGERMLPSLRFLKSAAAPEIRVPLLVGYSREMRLLVTTAIDGRPLASVLEDPIESRVAASLKRLGRSLASFHSIRTPGPSARSADRPSFGRWDASAEIESLDDVERRLLDSSLEPRVADRLAEGVSALRADLANDAGVARAASVVHRRLHPGHVFYGSDGIGLADLDDASFGEPEHDLGVLIAHMILSDLKRGVPVRLAPARADALRAGYLGGGVLRPNRLAAYTSSALLRLATTERARNGGVGAPDWSRLTGVLIDEALPEAVRV